MKDFISKISILIGVLLVVFIGIYLIKTLNPNAEEVTTIRWCVDPSPIRKETIALFEKSNSDIKVINDIDAGFQRLLTQLAGDVPPDVMAAYDIETLNTFYKYDLLLDLTPYIKDLKIPVNDFYPELKDFMYCDDKLVGIPENVGSFDLFYNKKVFDECNVLYPSNDWTWEDMFEAAKKLTSYKEVNGRKVPVRKGLTLVEVPFIFVWMYNGKVYNEDGTKCIIDSEESRKGMRFWEEMRMKAKVIPSASEAASMAATGGWGGDQLLFANGKVAMLITGRYMVTAFRNFKGLDFGIAQFPKAPYPNNVLLSKAYCIPKNSKNKEAAIKFLIHLTSNQNQNLVADYGDAVPSMNTLSIVKNFLYNPNYPNETDNQNVIDDLVGSKPIERSKYVSQTDFNQISTLELGRVWLGQQNMDTACRNIAKRVNQIIQRNMNNPNFVK